ncbi:flotillin family protein [Acaryochloris sp. CCMEE 5410]|uniref:flotillin family protein n=1 Tax=Acaryochloris sp. CCMEE 5410 TaxID=310037 RepID=UPI00024846A4|nr:SPFH domain-containing protein [Acaryochloris sp. CCMEE 5410]KAI9134305.1 flotillin [Acaryochloris sp. CCMEE 5410]
MELITLLLGLSGLSLVAGWSVTKNFYCICQPSEVLIFAGPRTRLTNGQTMGYRLVKGGSSLQMPLLEQTFRMDLTNMIIDLQVTGAYSKGGIPLTVTGVANIKIAGTEPTIHNAIERLLGKKRAEVEQLAKETLEGNLRGVLASLTPEQANSDQIAFAKSLLEEAEADLEKLGLLLDSLQIQTISDEVSYLDSLGRQQQAELIRDARIAEAKAKAESQIQDSANLRRTALRQLRRDEEIAKADADKRVRDALTRRVAAIEEVESVVGVQVARVQAEAAVETERIRQVEQQLQADVIAPAEADCQAAIATAKGKAAQIIEEGKAQATGTRQLGQSWQAAGAAAQDIFMFQQLHILTKLMAASVPDVSVQNVTVIDAQRGATATKLAAFLEQFQQATGMDMQQVLGKLTSPETSTEPSWPKVEPGSDLLEAAS